MQPRKTARHDGRKANCDDDDGSHGKNDHLRRLLLHGFGQCYSLHNGCVCVCRCRGSPHEMKCFGLASLFPRPNDRFHTPNMLAQILWSFHFPRPIFAKGSDSRWAVVVFTNDQPEHMASYIYIYAAESLHSVSCTDFVWPTMAGTTCTYVQSCEYESREQRPQFWDDDDLSA